MTGIKDIVAEEWRQFQLVQNEGGRASCQDDFPEFQRQRESQFKAWPQQLLDSYYQDLLDAAQQGRNLLTEKYAYMMRETAPERFAAMEHLLPPVDGEKRALVEEIVAAHLEWAEAFAAEFLRHFDVQGHGKRALGGYLPAGDILGGDGIVPGIEQHGAARQFERIGPGGAFRLLDIGDHALRQ